MAVSAALRARSVISVLRDWPYVVLDKSGVGSGEHVYRTRSGLKVICRLGSSDIEEIVVVLSGIEYPMSFIEPFASGVILDVGANVGAFALLLRQHGMIEGCDLHVIEPSVANQRVLLANLALNDITATLHRAAVAGRSGTVTLVETGRPDSFHIASDTDAPGSRVEAIRLDDLCQRAGIDRVRLLKVDIEGAEYDAIPAVGDWLFSCVDAMVIELHGPIPGRRDDLRSFLRKGFRDLELEHHNPGALFLARR